MGVKIPSVSWGRYYGPPHWIVRSAVRDFFDRRRFAYIVGRVRLNLISEEERDAMGGDVWDTAEEGFAYIVLRFRFSDLNRQYSALTPSGNWQPVGIRSSAGVVLDAAPGTARNSPLLFHDVRSAEAKAWRLRNHIPDWWPWLTGALLLSAQIAAIVVPYLDRTP